MGKEINKKIDNNIKKSINNNDVKRNVNKDIKKIEINTEYIKLDQLLKWANFTSSGSEAKIFIQDGRVKVNGEIETRRGKKIYEKDIVEFNNEKIIIKRIKA